MLYDLIPNMPEARLEPLILRFQEMIQTKTVLLQLFPIAEK